MTGVGAGAGPVSYACGNCGRILLESLFDGQVRNIVIQCTRCGSFNETPPAHEFN
ncbi:MAG TPA: hypothetical protein VMJ70_14140 [Candidatus Sulfotelmatobacter sp.]|nr:hypothetical protein [Candidatus Sulfotelmatobacter sp.]